ncbi:ribosome maturation factor RimM [Kingella kingae]|uniref:ribosome maturation factor RimM n=1 Tax=Kingella kingae TaxID=504 RepID=UPI0003FD1518|nr:ribosome maturation factor RimM [Kingella kingae]MDK4529079.1 ribosome maturation factor RimM [Kingella kingae]MDK4543616.1 ribosome maturation factor RimM [Kingella kingae]MDK4563203.1 ribosome maturation factor RimM [Kingella kingae]MDK4564324.1 ribosome maturation factor RimM [Kingella kingae]MDK4579029.1 ribosome maturation factor RimM [Kingella kingae]
MSDTQNWVGMGYIKGAFGVKGWVKVQASTEYADSLLDYPTWRLVKGKDMQIAEVEFGKVAGDELQVKFTHINDRDAAALMRGYTIEVSRDEFAETEEDEFYWADLVGMQVVNRENIALGEVAKLMETGAHDVLIVRGEHGEKLIPFVSHFVDDVNKETRVITVDWGLDY